MFNKEFDPEHCVSYKNNVLMYNIIAHRLNIPYEIFDETYLEDVWKRRYIGIGTKVTIKFKDQLYKFPYNDTIDYKKTFCDIINKTLKSDCYIGHKQCGHHENDISEIYFLIDEDVDF